MSEWVIHKQFHLTKTDFFEIVESIVNQKLDQLIIDWDDSKALSIVQCSVGYPENYKNNQEIKNLEKIFLKENEFIFHAGTKIENGKIFKWSRVLNFILNLKILNLAEKLLLS